MASEIADLSIFKIFLTDLKLFKDLPDGFYITSEKEADVIISDKVGENFTSSAFKIYVCDKKPAVWDTNVKLEFDGWVIRNDLKALDSLVRENIKPKSQICERSADILSKVALYDSITAQNCDMIKEQLRHNVSAIRDIFQ
ncbi:MAG: hypothetical protein RL154_1509, partial [Pseudomonadota bacterium]